jgi:hypothetical protein
MIPDNHCWAQPDTHTTVKGGRRCAFPPTLAVPRRNAMQGLFSGAVFGANYIWRKQSY